VKFYAGEEKKGVLFSCQSFALNSHNIRLEIHFRHLSSTMKFSMLAIAAAALTAGVNGFAGTQMPAARTFAVRQVRAGFHKVDFNATNAYARRSKKGMMRNDSSNEG